MHLDEDGVLGDARLYTFVNRQFFFLALAENCICLAGGGFLFYFSIIV
jgi:hypothetical protein